MEIRDIIHGAIEVYPNELSVIDASLFQRLRFIKQLGFSEHAFPSASHNRYMHSIGAMHTVTLAFRSIFSKPPWDSVPEKTLSRWEATVRLSALLHDIGHGPLSHTTEFAMPPVEQLGLSSLVNHQEVRQASHEDYGLKILLDSSFTPILKKACEEEGTQPVYVAGLIHSALSWNEGDDFFWETVKGQRVNFKPLFQQLISSELDADRMDYLRRDSLHCGVSYGEFDIDWLLSNLTAHLREQNAHLCIEHKALYTFEDFLISRFHMFLMVYMHHKSVVYDEMLKQYLESSDCQYKIPTSIEQFENHHDFHLYVHLSQSKNEWAQRITKKNPFRMLVEFHSGIPADEESQRAQDETYEKITQSLSQRGVNHLKVHSSGELSKYFRKPGFPIFVRYDNHYSKPSFIPLEQCTDLFQKYEKKQTIRRIYVSPEDLRQLKSEKMRGQLPFQQIEVS